MRLSIVFAINSIYTKSVKFRHRQAYRLSIISLIVTLSRLSFASVYSTICTKSIVIAYKICYKRPIYFGLPGVSIFTCTLNFISNVLTTFKVLMLLKCEAIPDSLTREEGFVEPLFEQPRQRLPPVSPEFLSM
jgi:hypothetical protein